MILNRFSNPRAILTDLGVTREVPWFEDPGDDEGGVGGDVGFDVLADTEHGHAGGLGGLLGTLEMMVSPS